MKFRGIKLLMVAILVLQSITFTSVYASTGTGVSIDFSQSGGYTPVYNTPADKQNNAIVYGQYGKAADDASLRMYSLGGTYYNNRNQDSRSNQYIQVIPDLTVTSSGEYIHLSFEYLRENYYSGLNVNISFKDSNGTVVSNKALLTSLPTNATYYHGEILFNNLGTTNGSSRYAYQSIGQWDKVDVYFSPSTNTATSFVNGSGKLTTTFNSSWGTTVGLTSITDLKFTHILNATINPKASAVHIDNVVVDVATSIPDSQSYKALGEALNFDDNMSVTANGEYGISYYNGVAARFSTGLSTTNRGSVKFFNNTTYAYAPVGGIYDRPLWDKSLHISIPVSATGTNGTTGMCYYPDITDISDGEVGHLSFAVANANSNCNVGIINRNGTFNASLFEMSTETGTFNFGGLNSGIKWTPQKWYKIDMFFNRAQDGTRIDCYIDNKQVISDYKCTSAQIVNIGRLYFSDTPGSDYYIDDISYGRTTVAEIADFSLASSATSYVNTKEKVVAIESDGDVAQYLAGNSAKNVTLYNADGLIVYNGDMTSATTVKVTNNFGGGVYYNVGYVTPKLSIGEILYDEDAKTISTNAIGFGTKENFSAADAVIPENGTIILAIYSDNTLENVIPVAYENISQIKFKPISLTDVETVKGKTVKAFIVDSENSLTPLVKNSTINY